MAITLSGSGIIEANLADDAVTLAKMAGGTDGELITYDASGNPANIAAGTAGQILTSTGAGSAPTMQDAAGGGAWTLVGSVTASNDASLTITGLTGAPVMFVGVGLHPSTDNVYFWMRFGDSAGIDSGATDYRWASYGQNVNGTGQSTASGYKYWEDSKIKVHHVGGTDGEIGSTAGEGLSFDAFLYNGQGGEHYPSVRGKGVGMDTDTALTVGDFGGSRTSLITVDRVNFLFESGNIVSGSIYVYELATS